MKKLFVIGMAVLLLVVFTMPAMAKVKIGGIVFTDFYYLDRDKANAKAADSYTATAIQVPDFTRLYAIWTNEDNVGLRIELGLGQGSGGIDGSAADKTADHGGAKLRLAYGWWDVTPTFQILAGQNTTPFSQLSPSQLLGFRSGSANVLGAGYGEFYSGRFVQVRGTFKFGKVARLEVALVDPNGSLAAVGQIGPWTAYQNNTKIPRIDIGVPIHAGPVSFYPSFMYQHRTVDNATPAGVDNSLDTYIGSLGIRGGFGPFGISLEGNYGKNWGNSRGFAGVSPAAGIASATLNATTSKVNDADTLGFWVDLSYKFGPITPHVIYGIMQTDRDNAAGNKQEAKTQMIGFSIPIDLAKGFRLRPEIMWYDDGDLKTTGSTSQDKGKYMIAGVQFQITF